MPELNEMKCIICEEIKTLEEISANEGMCEGCAQAMREADDQADAPGGGDEESLAKGDIQAALKRYQKRKEYMAKYNDRPEVKEKRKQYMKDRARKERELVKKAKALGLMDQE